MVLLLQSSFSSSVDSLVDYVFLKNAYAYDFKTVFIQGGSGHWAVNYQAINIQRSISGFKFSLLIILLFVGTNNRKKCIIFMFLDQGWLHILNSRCVSFSCWSSERQEVDS